MAKSKKVETSDEMKKRHEKELKTMEKFLMWERLWDWLKTKKDLWEFVNQVEKDIKFDEKLNKNGNPKSKTSS